jgi:hypothetical protein
MLFPEIDLTVPTAFEAAAWGDADDGVAEAGRAPTPNPMTTANMHTIGKPIVLIHLFLCRFISSTKRAEGSCAVFVSN